MSRERIRHLADVNPATPEFDRISDDALVTFAPLETIWADNRLDLTRVRHKAEVAVGYTRFRPGDVLVPKVTPTFQAGRSAIAGELVNGVGGGSTELHVLRPRSCVDGRYLRYIALSKPFLDEGVSAFQGVAGLQRVPDEFVRDFPVHAPLIEEQRRIADFLDAETSRLDHLLLASVRQAELLRERWLERLRHVTTHGRSRDLIATDIPWMPEIASDWRLVKIAYCFQTGSGTTPKSDIQEYFGGSIPWVNTGDLQDRRRVTASKTVTHRALSDYPALRVHPNGSLVVAMYGATIGRVGILGQASTVNQACCVLSQPSEVDTKFVFYWFMSHRNEIVDLGSGAGQANISQEIIRRLRVPVPSRQVQREIRHEIEARDEDRERYERALARRVRLLGERRRGLITAAVTGQIDVTTARGVADRWI